MESPFPTSILILLKGFVNQIHKFHDYQLLSINVVLNEATHLRQPS